MSALRRLTVAALSGDGAEHGFFGRAGGVSTGIYESLNTGLGTNDDPAAVAENRARCAAALGGAPDSVITLYQIHSAEAVIVDEPWAGRGPRADAMATDRPGVTLGILTADCMPFLFFEREAGVIGAAHAGWRGALAGVLDSCIGVMEKLGAKPERIAAGLGPCLRQDNFEVGLDVLDAFMQKHPQADRFFAPGASAGKRQFDLAGFGRWRLAERGVENLDDTGLCTLAAPDAWFSYRASRRAGAADYGRNLSAIRLSG